MPDPLPPATVLPTNVVVGVTVLTPVPPTCHIICVGVKALATVNTPPVQGTLPERLGVAATLIVTCAVLVQPVLPVTVYVVVVVGVAVTLTPVVADRVAVGDHV